VEGEGEGGKERAVTVGGGGRVEEGGGCKLAGSSPMYGQVVHSFIDKPCVVKPHLIALP
jgi:hypothetical protein